MKLDPMQLPSSSNVMSSIAAMAKPSVRPPVIWPSTIIGLMRTPQSSTATSLQHLPLPGAAVDLDDRRVRAERERHVRRVVVGDALEAGLEAVGRFV